MPPTTTHSTSPHRPARRRQPARRLDPLGELPAAQTAAAMDDADEAQALMDDLVALLDAGLIAAVSGDGDTVRYAVADRPADPQPGERPFNALSRP